MSVWEEGGRLFLLLHLIFYSQRLCFSFDAKPSVGMLDAVTTQLLLMPGFTRTDWV